MCKFKYICFLVLSVFLNFCSSFGFRDYSSLVDNVAELVKSRKFAEARSLAREVLNHDKWCNHSTDGDYCVSRVEDPGKILGGIDKAEQCLLFMDQCSGKALSVNLADKCKNKLYGSCRVEDLRFDISDEVNELVESIKNNSAQHRYEAQNDSPAAQELAEKQEQCRKSYGWSYIKLFSDKIFNNKRAFSKVFETRSQCEASRLQDPKKDGNWCVSRREGLRITHTLTSMWVMNQDDLGDFRKTKIYFSSLEKCKYLQNNGGSVSDEFGDLALLQADSPKSHKIISECKLDNVSICDEVGNGFRVWNGTVN